MPVNEYGKVVWGKRKPRPNQPSLFDQAEKLANEGMEVSYKNSTSIYKRSARERINWLIANRREFTSDDVIEYLDEIGVVGNNSALGAIFKAFSRTGLITHTDRFKRSRRPNRHGQTVAIWRSNVR